MDITPAGSQFLFGYPHVERYSTGIHDPLFASALYLCDGRQGILFIGCDVIFMPKALVSRARARIADITGISGEQVMITATHTHSGPITTSMASNEADATVPPPDPAFLAQLEDGVVSAGVRAYQLARPADLAFDLVDGTGLGTNRRDPAGPSIPTVPILVAHDIDTQSLIGVMCVVSMHPTVLHEDWTLISGDFPGLARRWLKQNVVGEQCPFVYHMGASGNQSPRHVVQANTIEEAQRLGEVLGRAVATGLERAQPIQDVSLEVRRSTIDLPLRQFPSVQEAAARLHAAQERLAQLRAAAAEPTRIRTAECDWFGAEETLTLSKAAQTGRLDDAARACLPAEVQVVRLGQHAFVGWPGEVFVEFALEVMGCHRNAHIITLANGDLQGYVVTREAVEEGGYEASNALFASPESGERLVRTTLDLLNRPHPRGEVPCPSF